MCNILNENGAAYPNSELFKNHLLEQYKLYVEMADRISARRNLTNVFFLSANTIFLTLFGILLEKGDSLLIKLTLFLLIGVVLIDIIWFFLLLKYKKITKKRYENIAMIETQLPLTTFGSETQKFFKLVTLEKLVPVVFILIFSFLIIFISNKYY